ncbi:MAG TPA: hypothetical protein VG815_17410 [Chloroflexota bacterium]|jgi:division/cell wall cluster transcriptional repressor MraZ|nr:hypothetical protein [Chloroflexota bacterium]
MLYPPCNVDPDGTIELPPGAAIKVGQTPVLAPTVDHALGLYPIEIWDDLTRRFDSLGDLRYEARLLLQLVKSNAVKIDISESNRILIPEQLLRLGQLGDRVLTVSTEDHFELWSPEIWFDRDADARNDASTHDVA